MLTHEEIKRRAYELYEERGRADGHDWDDWLQAERELQGAKSATEQFVDAAETRTPSRRRKRVEPVEASL